MEDIKIRLPLRFTKAVFSRERKNSEGLTTKRIIGLRRIDAAMKNLSRRYLSEKYLNMGLSHSQKFHSRSGSSDALGQISTVTAGG